MTDSTNVELVLRREVVGKPPQTDLIVDAHLSNGSSEARWFLIPTPNAVAGGGGVHTLQEYAESADQPAIMGEFIGTSGFWAIQVAGRAAVAVRDLRLSLFDNEPPCTEIVISPIVASSIAIGDAPILSWMPGSVACSHDVAFQQLTMVRKRTQPGYAEVRVTYDIDCRLSAPIVRARTQTGRSIDVLSTHDPSTKR